MEGKNELEQMFVNVKDYAETRFDIVVLNLQEKVSGILSSAASAAIMGILGVFIIFFISIGAAWLIGQSLDNPSIGFFCIGGFYLLLGIIFYVNRDKWVKIPIINGVLKKININEED
jgi:hypothetical protein